MSRFLQFLLRRRWIYVVPLVLPASKLYGWIERLRLRARSGSPERHDERVTAVQRAVRDRPRTSSGLCTARKDRESIALSQPDSYKKRGHRVEIPLYDVLGLDTGRGVVRVEPGVTMGTLTSYLVERGWTLAVVPELEDLTAGGLFLGYGIETSSHRHGLFSSLVESCDVVLGDGTLITASRTQHTDLFHALPWSRGSLGFLVALELRVIPAVPWVRLTYRAVSSVEETHRVMAELASAPGGPEFVEGFLFSPHEGVVVSGDFAEHAPAGTVNRIGRWHKPWFHEHARAKARARDTGAEHVPLRQYYHRHSRGIFWAAALLVPFGNHPVFRWLLGWLMPPKISFLKLTETPGLRQAYLDSTATQEGLVPIEHMSETLHLCHELFEAYPVWLCPAKLTRTEPAGLASPAAAEQLYMDIAVIFTVPGPVQRGEPWSARTAVRAFEAWLRDHNGFPVPYAASDMSREDFRSTFDCELYDRVRKDYGLDESFLDVCDKLKRL